MTKREKLAVKYAKQWRSSEALKALGWKVMQERVSGVCAREGCGAKTAHPRAHWCKACKKAVRSVQLALNARRFRKQKPNSGKPLRALYGGKPTVLARLHPDVAVKALEKAEWSRVKDKEAAVKLIRQQAAVAAEAAKAGGKANKLLKTAKSKGVL